MTREEFSVLFEEARRRATSAFSRVCGKLATDPDMFEANVPGIAGGIVSANDVLDAIFVSENRFYKVIDVGLISRGNGPPIGFIRVSGHAPCPYEETLNPQDLGPFNILEPLPRHGPRIS